MRAGVFRAFLSCAALFTASLFLCATARAASVERVSVSSSGEQTDCSYCPGYAVISADGRFVAFWSAAANLVPGDTNNVPDVFVRDRLARTTERVSVSSSGEQGNYYSSPYLTPAISADGRFVAFASAATNLVPGDTNQCADVFVRDRLAGTAERANLSSSGEQANEADPYWRTAVAISADGRFVAFTCDATNLVPGDTNGQTDIFVRDRAAGTTERASVSSSGEQASEESRGPFLSADGRFVGFSSYAPNLVAGDTNGSTDLNSGRDVFVRDRTSGTTERVSVGSSGEQANGPSYCHSMSADGRYVAFDSYADNLVSGDTNGRGDVFVRDRVSDTTERVSVSSSGEQANQGGEYGAISADGRFVALSSNAINLVPGDANAVGDIFLRDRVAGTTQLVSVGGLGWQADGGSWLPSVSADGRMVAFVSDATNLVPDDTNWATDLFVRDMQPGTLVQPQIAINQDIPCTNSQAVTLWLAFPEGCSEMRLRNEPGDWEAWGPIASTKPWTLLPGEGPKTVCVQCRDSQGNVSPETCAEIALDTSPPVNATIALEQGGACNYSQDARLTASSADAYAMRFSRDGQSWGWPWQGCTSAAVPWIIPRGLSNVWVQLRDRCGNETPAILFKISRPLFDDVTCRDPQRPDIEALTTNGIASGCATSPRPLFCPDDATTRRVMAKAICIAAGKTPYDRPTPTFADVPKTHPQYGWIERLAYAPSWGGTPVTYGCGKSGATRTFCPDAAVTREQAAAFICHATGKPPMPSCLGTFADVQYVRPFCPYVERLADPASWGGTAVTGGCGKFGSTRFYCPTHPLSRGEMAVMLVRAFGIPL